jgi:hypothetical protein
MIGYHVEVAVKAETLMSSPSETAAANSVGLMFQGAMRSIPPDHSPGARRMVRLSVSMRVLRDPLDQVFWVGRARAVRSAKRKGG